MDAEALSEALDIVASAEDARRRRREVDSLRGVRGVPDSEIAMLATAAWLEQRPSLPDDEDELSRLFGSAFEDGLVAVGLLAALVPDDPRDAFDIGLDWLDRADDAFTADALGWFVLGPSLLAASLPLTRLLDATHKHRRPTGRRAGVMAGLAMTPSPLSGPAAAPLRARLGERTIRFVDAPLSEQLAPLATAFVRDESPAVRKALRRVLTAWASSDADACEVWMNGVSGGVPKMLRKAVEQGVRKARRPARRHRAAE